MSAFNNTSHIAIIQWNRRRHHGASRRIQDDCGDTSAVPFLTNIFSRPDHIPSSVFAKSVRLTKEGIERNKYNHHAGNPASNPHPCNHETVQPWEIGWDATAGWASRKKWTCDQCKKDLTNEKWDDELKEFDAVRKEDNHGEGTSQLLLSGAE